MYVLLYGAKKNAGDYLIYERAKELIQAYKPDSEFLELPRWKSITPYLDIINRKAKAIVICGGPGYAENFYPRILPLTNDLTQIKIPIVPLALGWSGKGDPNTFEFTNQSLEMIRDIHTRTAFSSVRDILTEQILNRAGFNNVIMTGCTVWHYLPLIQRDFVPPKSLKRIVITTPAHNSNMAQASNLLRLVKQKFPNAELNLVFHRGILPDRRTGLRAGVFNTALALQGYIDRYHVVNAAYSTQHIRFYEECDLHIGYRVHAHLDFLSYRKPSILIQEDGRGLGQSLTLGTKDVLAQDHKAPEHALQTLDYYLDTQFQTFHQTISYMQETHKVMRQFIEGL